MPGVITTLATVGSEFHREIVHSGRLSAFLFFVALLGTFAFIRMSTWMIRKQVSWWPGNVSVGGTHVHHLVWGICAMMIFGYVGVVHQPGSPWWEIVTVFFAIGMGLALDEFALWVELKDVYWEKDGRKSIDAMIIAGCAAGVLLVGFSAWVTLADEVEGSVFAGAGAFGLVGIAIALVNAAKEKLWWALVVADLLARRGCARGPTRQASFDLGAPLLSRRAPAGVRGSLRGGRRRRDARIRRLGRPRSRFRAPGLIVVGRRPELFEDHTQRGRDRDRQQRPEDAGELGAGEHRDHRHRRRQLDGVLVEDRLHDPVLNLLVDHEQAEPDQERAGEPV